jgi:hypothetical protein
MFYQLNFMSMEKQINQYITNYASILDNKPYATHLATNYFGSPLPQFNFPLTFENNIAFDNPDIPGLLSTQIDYIISIVDAKPSLNINHIYLKSYITDEQSQILIYISLNDQTLSQVEANHIAQQIWEISDNDLQVSANPLNSQLYIFITETF